MAKKRDTSVDRPTDAATWAQTVRPPQFEGMTRRSTYVTMRDGVRIAVEIYLPEGLDPGATVPAILQQTRYFRAAAFRRVGRALRVQRLLDQGEPGRAYFVARGYAWIHACARGSGASEGVRPFPWGPDEVADGGELVDWIVSQPWSDGRVAATGVSYDGTAAEMLLRNQHSAVKAVVPRFSLFDAYADVAFPGGVHLQWFTEKWGMFNRWLDANAHSDAIAGSLAQQAEAFAQWLTDKGSKRRVRLVRAGAGPMARKAYAGFGRLVSRGVRPVDDAPEALPAAVAQHAQNYDVHAGAMRLVDRDDVGLSSVRPDAAIDAFSPHAFAREITASETPIYSYSGWFDAGYPKSAIMRFNAIKTPGSRLILGPWDHGGGQNGSPHRGNHKTAFDHDAEIFRYIDGKLGGTDNDGPAVRYFTMGAERWQHSETWPPPEVRPQAFVLHPEALEPIAPEANTTTEVHWVPSLGTGARARWRTLLGVMPPVGYAPPQQSNSSRRRFRSAPLEAPLEVTGHPIVTLWISAHVEDASVFAYLEHESPDGVITVFTEGLLRLRHRKVTSHSVDPLALPERTFLSADASPMPSGEPVDVTFDLLPTSFEIPAGHRVSLAVALGDADHFRPVLDVPHSVHVHHGSSYASRLVLPVVRR